MSVCTLKVRYLEDALTSCPAQWSGETVNGDRVYVRYRYGILRVDINGETAYREVIGGEYDGFMETETMLRHTGLTVLELR